MTYSLFKRPTNYYYSQVFYAFFFAVASSLVGAIFVLVAEGLEYFGVKDE